MQQFAFLTIGFEKPTPEIMQEWQAWFASIQDRIVSQVGLMNGQEISASGTADLAMDANAVTGMMVIEAEDRAEAMDIAARNPFITSIRVYDLMGH